MPTEPTGIIELDELLGGGIPCRSFVLVKGGPGTGKTTLCFQIIAKALERGKSCTYVSVETTAEAALAHACRCFHMLSAEQKGKLSCLSVRNVLSAAAQQQAQTTTEPSRPEDEEFQIEQLDPFPDAVDNLPSLSEFLRNFWRQVFRVDQRMEVEDAAGLGPPISIIVLDSITALVDAIENQYRGQFTERQVMLSLLNAFKSRSFRDWLAHGHSIVYLIAERAAPGSGHDAPESYIADCIIELASERVLRSPESERPVPIGPLLFCQVTKARGQANQRRRCCYDFTAEGVTFFPTYAAEGRVVLFWENASQRYTIEQLRKVDTQALFPLVEVEDFNRSGLQTAFSVKRRASDIPLRRPMVLGNVDEYWIKVLREAAVPGKELLAPIRRDEVALYLSTNGAYEIIRELDWKQLHHQDGRLVAVPHWVNVGMLVYRTDLIENAGLEPPNTWEELEEACAKLKCRFLLETRSYDSFMTTMLELMWNHGAVFQVKEGKVVWLVGDEAMAVESMVRLNKWFFFDGIVSVNSTVDPDLHSADDWVFARHWYSTLVHMLFTRDEKTGEPRAREIGCDPAHLRVMRMPVSEKYLNQGLTEVPQIRVKAPGHSAWGEWYLAIQGGTENGRLALDIINNLMSSRKIVERALSGGGLPPVEKFYERYGRATCPGTNCSFAEVRETFFPYCLSRTLIEDYPRVARILYGACLPVVGTKMSEMEVQDLVHGAFCEIEC